MILQPIERLITDLFAFFQVIKHLLEGLVEVTFEDTGHELVEPRLIFVVHQPVVVDTENLVDKQADHGLLAIQRVLLQQQAALDDA